MAILKKIAWGILNPIFFNYARPRYFASLYVFAERYVKFYQNDGNHDRATNGGWRFLKEYLATTKPKVIFDVGGHIGTYTLKIRELDPNVEVYAFEPVNATYRLLEKNVAGTQGLHAINLALSSTSGTRTIHINSEENSISSLTQAPSPDYAHNTVEQIRCSTVDEFCAEHDIARIDMLKIDTEGHDLEVIKGAERMLREGRIGLIQFEFGTLNTFSHTYIWDFYSFLAPFGYELFKIKPLGLERVVAPENERSVYAYFVAMQKSPTPSPFHSSPESLLTV